MSTCLLLGTPERGLVAGRNDDQVFEASEDMNHQQSPCSALLLEGEAVIIPSEA